MSGSRRACEMLPLDKRLESILSQISLASASIRTLSLGCGEYSEFTLLHELYPGGLHIGVDWDRAALGNANGWVVQADGLALPFACQFNLILIRHPDVSLHTETWAQIFSSLPRWLEPAGVFIATCYTLEEWSLIRRWIKLPAVEIDLLALAPPDLAGRDRYVVVSRNDAALP